MEKCFLEVVDCSTPSEVSISPKGLIDQPVLINSSRITEYFNPEETRCMGFLRCDLGSGSSEEQEWTQQDAVEPQTHKRPDSTNS